MRWERSYRVCLSPIYADGTSDEIIYRGGGQEGRFIFARISNKNLNEGEWENFSTEISMMNWADIG